MIKILLLSMWGTLSLRLIDRALKAKDAKDDIECQKKYSDIKKRVSVIIPVRNEEHNIAGLLESLKGQEADEIIVVDDGSNDGTVSVVSSFLESIPNLKLAFADPLPCGWTGKNNACYGGYRKSSGDILIFIDADVRLFDGALNKLKTKISSCELGLLSVSPLQSMVSFGERAVLPGLFLNIVANIDFRATNDPDKPDKALANGQIMAFTREAYEKMGTHAAVKSEVGEDVAIAKKIKEAGIKSLFFYDDGSFAFVRMYRGLKECIGGFSKNISDIVGAHSWISVLRGSFLSLFSAVSSISVVVMLFYGAFEGFAFWLAIFVSILWWGAGAATVMAMRIPFLYTLLLPFGYLSFAYLVPKSYLLKMKKKRSWKGREY